MDTSNNNVYARWLVGNISEKEEQTLRMSGDLQSLEIIIKAADKLTLPKYDAAAEFDILKANLVASKTKKARSLVVKRLWPLLAVAAGVFFLIYVGSTLLSGPNLIKTGNTETLAHQFIDESSVILNDGSSLTYEEKNWSAVRSLALTGEAFFQVEKGQPFIVNTSLGIVRVLGTSFNVRAWGEQLSVECYTGKVEVEYAGQTTILEKGEAVIGSKGTLQNKQTIPYETPLWTTGSSRFYETPIVRVLEELERQYDIQVNGPQIERTFSGSFRHNDLETALREICQPMGLTYFSSVDGKTVTIEE